MARVQPSACLRHQRSQLGVGAGGSHMLDHDVAPITALSELNLRAARPPRSLPHEHHQRTLPTPGVCRSGPPARRSPAKTTTRSSLRGHVARVRPDGMRDQPVQDRAGSAPRPSRVTSLEGSESGQPALLAARTLSTREVRQRHEAGPMLKSALRVRTSVTALPRRTCFPRSDLGVGPPCPTREPSWPWNSRRARGVPRRLTPTCLWRGSCGPHL